MTGTETFTVELRSPRGRLIWSGVRRTRAAAVAVAAQVEREYGAPGYTVTVK